VIIEDTVMQKRAERYQDNMLAMWPEQGLPGIQFGPNKKRRKW